MKKNLSYAIMLITILLLASCSSESVIEDLDVTSEATMSENMSLIRDYISRTKPQTRTTEISKYGKPSDFKNDNLVQNPVTINDFRDLYGDV